MWAVLMMYDAINSRPSTLFNSFLPTTLERVFAVRCHLLYCRWCLTNVQIPIDRVCLTFGISSRSHPVRHAIRAVLRPRERVGSRQRTCYSDTFGRSPPTVLDVRSINSAPRVSHPAVNAPPRCDAARPGTCSTRRRSITNFRMYHDRLTIRSAAVRFYKIEGSSDYKELATSCAHSPNKDHCRIFDARCTVCAGARGVPTTIRFLSRRARVRCTYVELYLFVLLYE
ncbi:hypothetical protein EVAR_37333_1 [Eumeta japonica]|uniref:Uncharacterized protein n=1 Tax=Eumeta variegata TaxID=151549 RepID=A0A4C1WXR9_EUMVA|nr:hypothetical protein EVAR_37333_1 [Eumeta japonica]